MKRYNLFLQESQFNKIRQKAEQEGETVATILRRYIKLGIYAYEHGPIEIVREDGTRQQVELFPERDEDTVCLW